MLDLTDFDHVRFPTMMETASDLPKVGVKHIHEEFEEGGLNSDIKCDACI